MHRNNNARFDLRNHFHGFFGIQRVFTADRNQKNINAGQLEDTANSKSNPAPEKIRTIAAASITLP